LVGLGCGNPGETSLELSADDFEGYEVSGGWEFEA
jgi:hypothetical protein